MTEPTPPDLPTQLVVTADAEVIRGPGATGQCDEDEE